MDKLFKVDEGRRNKLPVTDQGKKKKKKNLDISEIKIYVMIKYARKEDRKAGQRTEVSSTESVINRISRIIISCLL